jgi:threo-3-hydroxy-L-aspartate ammonia-lyase
VAYAARAFGVPAVIVVPEGTPDVKRQATEALGATVIVVPPSERAAAAALIEAERGMVMVPPFDHPEVIAGQGTVGLEIAEDLPDVELVLAPISGGGLVSGIAVALKALVPGVRVVGVEPELAGDAADSFRLGERVAWDVAQTMRTIADGLRNPQVGVLPWAHIREHVDDIVAVGEDEIRAAMRTLVLRSRLVVEPSGAVAAAAYLAREDVLPAGRTVVVVSGGNVAPSVLTEVLGG